MFTGLPSSRLKLPPWWLPIYSHCLGSRCARKHSLSPLTSIYCSTRRIDRIAALCREGVAKVRHRNSGQQRTRQSNKTTEAIAWMGTYFHLVGEHMPDADRIHLPSFLTKRDVYERMTAGLRENGLDEREIISLSQFYYVWDTNFPQVQIPEVR